MFIDEGFFFTSLSICSKPFLKERSSDDSSHASAIINLLTELGRSKKIFFFFFLFMKCLVSVKVKFFEVKIPLFTTA